jgi:hypothetical protein
VTAHPTADRIAQQITEAFPWEEAPRLIRDRGRGLRCCCHPPPARHGHSRQANLGRFAVAERLCGTTDRHNPAGVRRPLGVFGEAHLRRVLIKFAAYYNECHIHRSLNKDAPFHRAIERLGAITTRPVLGRPSLPILPDLTFSIPDEVLGTHSCRCQASSSRCRPNDRLPSCSTQSNSTTVGSIGQFYTDSN